jgi:hypothetical protein
VMANSIGDMVALIVFCGQRSPASPDNRQKTT